MCADIIADDNDKHRVDTTLTRNIDRCGRTTWNDMRSMAYIATPVGRENDETPHLVRPR
jgi:hypothetical protein